MKTSPTLQSKVAGAVVVAALLGGALFASRTSAPTVRLARSVTPGQFVEHDVRVEERMRATPLSSASVEGSAPGEALVAHTVIDVRLRLEGVRAGDPGLARARFVEVRSASTQMGGRELLDARGLVGPVAEVELGADGLVRALRVPKSDDPTFGRVLALVLAESALPLGGGSQWTATEKSARATFSSTVRVDDVDVDAVSLSRARTIEKTSAARAATKRPPSLDGATRARVRTDGVLLSLAMSERTQAWDDAGALVEEREVNVRAAFAREGRVEPTASDADAAAALAQLAPLAPLDGAGLGDADAAGKRALEQRTEGLTRAALDAVMTDAIVSGRAPDHAKFLWRATARLKLDDAAVDDVAKQFARADATTPGRALALDLLAAASSAHAQEVLVALVQTPIVENDPESSRLKQRLALVPAPTPATIDFLIEKSKEPAGAWRDPARIALGAAVRHRSERDDAVGAARALEVLIAESRALEDERETEVALLALGNTYDATVAELIAAHASSPRAQTRHVVAEALREIDAPLARDTLLQLARDPAPEVARRALASLARQKLDDTHLSSLTASTQSGEVPGTALALVVSVVASRASEPGARAVLEAVLARGPDPQLRARVLHLLRGA